MMIQPTLTIGRAIIIFAPLRIRGYSLRISHGWVSSRGVRGLFLVLHPAGVENLDSSRTRPSGRVDQLASWKMREQTKLRGSEGV
jgi:hypothetical protein